MNSATNSVPAKAWVVTFAGMAVNLCLGILYGWSVWKSKLLASPEHPAGSAMTGVDAGWVYLTDFEATVAYAVCGLTFALFMIPGGWLQDKFGPRMGVTLGGLSLAAGCFVAGAMKSFLGLLLGFGLLGGIGMGLGYAAATPAAVKWFGRRQRGLIVGLVVGGYGGAAIYISPLGKYLITEYGISGSFYGLGALFALVVVVAGQLLASPPAGYAPPSEPAPAPAPNAAPKQAVATTVDWTAGEMLKTWQFFALVFMFFASAQSGLLVIGNAAPILNATAANAPAATAAFFAANAWLLASYGGLVNAVGRVGTGSYSDRLGRRNAYLLNAGLAAVCVFLMPMVMRTGNVWLLFLTVGVAYWQYGGGLALMPAMTADFFGPKNMGLNYGLVFLGWGAAFLVPQAAGYIKDQTGSLDAAFYLSGGLLIAGILLSAVVHRPAAAKEIAG